MTIASLHGNRLRRWLAKRLIRVLMLPKSTPIRLTVTATNQTHC